MSLRPSESIDKASVDAEIRKNVREESLQNVMDYRTLLTAAGNKVDAEEGGRAREDENRKEDPRRERLMNYQALFTSARRKFEDALALRNNVPATSEHTGQATVLIVKLLASTHTIVREQTREALPMLRWLLNLNDDNILKDTCKVLSRLTDGTDDIQVVNDGLYLRLLKLSSNQPSLRPPAFHKVGKIFAVDDLPTQKKKRS